MSADPAASLGLQYLPLLMYAYQTQSRTCEAERVQTLHVNLAADILLQSKFMSFKHVPTFPPTLTWFWNHLLPVLRSRLPVRCLHSHEWHPESMRGSNGYRIGHTLKNTALHIGLNNYIYLIVALHNKLQCKTLLFRTRTSCDVPFPAGQQWWSRKLSSHGQKGRP